MLEQAPGQQKGEGGVRGRGSHSILPGFGFLTLKRWPLSPHTSFAIAVILVKSFRFVSTRT